MFYKKEARIDQDSGRLIADVTLAKPPWPPDTLTPSNAVWHEKHRAFSVCLAFDDKNNEADRSGPAIAISAIGTHRSFHEGEISVVETQLECASILMLCTMKISGIRGNNYNSFNQRLVSWDNIYFV